MKNQGKTSLLRIALVWMLTLSLVLMFSACTSKTDDKDAADGSENPVAAATEEETDEFDWYKISGNSMAGTIEQAGMNKAYTLTDRSTWLKSDKKAGLQIVCEKDPTGILNNQYSVICVNPNTPIVPDSNVATVTTPVTAINHEGAVDFQTWITSAETQKLIKTYGVETYGESLFTPNAPGVVLDETTAPAADTTTTTTRKGSGVLRIGSSLSTFDSGLFEYILADFSSKFGYKLIIISVEDTEALKLAENGEVDVLLVHTPDLERAFVTAGHADQTGRVSVMYNDFVIVGPTSDPAGIKAAAGTNAVQAFTTIANKKVTFVSRGDNSAAHTRELEIWKKAGIDPNPAPAADSTTTAGTTGTTGSTGSAQ
ncbi:MAG: substrate-binding domain-containing protein [Coriobacteriales bacterium]|jgi:ABC-type tungstate transport system permease subunit|nr:substrate-binding domain-containing protein [Coriobacteriales bacterium]